MIKKVELKVIDSNPNNKKNTNITITY